MKYKCIVPFQRTVNQQYGGVGTGQAQEFSIGEETEDVFCTEYYVFVKHRDYGMSWHLPHSAFSICFERID